MLNKAANNASIARNKYTPSTERDAMQAKESFKRLGSFWLNQMPRKAISHAKALATTALRTDAVANLQNAKNNLLNDPYDLRAVNQSITFKPEDVRYIGEPYIFKETTIYYGPEVPEDEEDGAEAKPTATAETKAEDNKPKYKDWVFKTYKEFKEKHKPEETGKQPTPCYASIPFREGVDVSVIYTNVRKDLEDVVYTNKLLSGIDFYQSGSLLYINLTSEIDTSLLGDDKTVEKVEGTDEEEKADEKVKPVLNGIEDLFVNNVLTYDGSYTSASEQGQSLYRGMTNTDTFDIGANAAYVMGYINGGKQSFVDYQIFLNALTGLTPFTEYSYYEITDSGAYWPCTNIHVTSDISEQRTLRKYRISSTETNGSTIYTGIKVGYRMEKESSVRWDDQFMMTDPSLLQTYSYAIGYQRIYNLNLPLYGPGYFQGSNPITVYSLTSYEDAAWFDVNSDAANVINTTNGQKKSNNPVGDDVPCLNRSAYLAFPQLVSIQPFMRELLDDNYEELMQSGGSTLNGSNSATFCSYPRWVTGPDDIIRESSFNNTKGWFTPTTKCWPDDYPEAWKGKNNGGTGTGSTNNNDDFCSKKSNNNGSSNGSNGCSEEAKNALQEQIKKCNGQTNDDSGSTSNVDCLDVNMKPVVGHWTGIMPTDCNATNICTQMYRISRLYVQSNMKIWNLIPATSTKKGMDEFRKYAYDYFSKLKGRKYFGIQGDTEIALHLLVPHALLVYVVLDPLRVVWNKKYNSSKFFANRYPSFKVYVDTIVKYIKDFCPLGYLPLIFMRNYVGATWMDPNADFKNTLNFSD